MSDSLRLYRSILEKMKTFHSSERITRLRNLVLLVMGLYQGKSVHLAKIVKHWLTEARLLSRVRRIFRVS